MTPTVHQNTEVRQSQIVDAAMALMVKSGSDHVTVKRIAMEVGISQAAVYRHFRSKNDILSNLIDHVRDNLLEDIEKGRNNDKDSSTPGVVDRTIRAHLSAVADRKGVSFLVLADIVSMGDPKLNGKASEAIRQYTAGIADLLREGIKTGEIRGSLDIEAAASILFDLVHGMVSVWTLGDRDFPLKERCGLLWSIFSEGIVAR